MLVSRSGMISPRAVSIYRPLTAADMKTREGGRRSKKVAAWRDILPRNPGKENVARRFLPRFSSAVVPRSFAEETDV